MERVTLNDKTFVPFISYGKIEKAIDEVAAQVNKDFAGSDDVPIVLCILNGAILFCGELLKRLDFPCQLVSVKLSSYIGTRSTGKVEITGGLTADVTGRRILIVEDIVDTGCTIKAVKDLLASEGASEVRTCTLLLKPEVYKNPVKPEYVGIEIPNRFIVGFGLDYDELGRNLKDIYVLEA